MQYQEEQELTSRNYLLRSVASVCEKHLSMTERLQHYGALGGKVPLDKPKWPNLLSSHYRRIANFPFQKTYYANNCSVGDNSFR